jgi:hypothetical protein
MSTELWLFIGVITGAFGMAYFIYGKKQGKPVPLISGMLLCVYPYFFESTVLIIAIGILLIIAPFLIKYEF